MQDAGRVLMLGVGGEVFALDATWVREIMDPAPVTRVPGARGFVPGVINVRGAIVPLADLRLRFGMAATEQTSDTRYVVIELADGAEHEPLLVAIIADKVFEVCDMTAADAEAAPRLGMTWPPELVRGILKWKDEFVILPDMSFVLN